jgi:hypothetical protein
MHDVYMRLYFDTTSNLVYDVDHGFLVIGLPEMRCRACCIWEDGRLNIDY